MNWKLNIDKPITVQLMIEWKSLHALLDVAPWRWIPLCVSSSDGAFNEDSSSGMTLIMASCDFNEFLKLNHLGLHSALPFIQKSIL